MSNRFQLKKEVRETKHAPPENRHIDDLTNTMGVRYDPIINIRYSYAYVNIFFRPELCVHSGRFGILDFIALNRHLRAHAENVIPSAAAPARSNSSSSSLTEMDIACRLRWRLFRTLYRLTTSVCSSSTFFSSGSTSSGTGGSTRGGTDGFGAKVGITPSG